MDEEYSFITEKYAVAFMVAAIRWSFTIMDFMGNWLCWLGLFRGALESWVFCNFWILIKKETEYSQHFHFQSKSWTPHFSDFLSWVLIRNFLFIWNAHELASLKINASFSVSYLALPATVSRFRITSSSSTFYIRLCHFSSYLWFTEPYSRGLR